MQIVMMKVSDIVPSPWNPQYRTEDRKIKEIKNSISKDGIKVPLIIGSDGLLGDGHRRLKCAKELGISEVPVLVFDDMDSRQIYIMHGGTQAKITGKDWFQMVANGLSSDDVPSLHVRKELQKLERIMSFDEFQDLARRGRSPFVVDVAIAVARYIGNETDDMVRKIVLWLDKYSAQKRVNTAMDINVPPAILRRAIEEDTMLVEIVGYAPASK